MHLTSLLATAILSALVHGYTEVTQWTDLNCGLHGVRTSYLHIYGENVYINADDAAQSIYIEEYDAEGPTFFYSGYNGRGYRGREVQQGYCYVWDYEEAASIANPPGYRYEKRDEEMSAGEVVLVDEQHKGLGQSLLQESEVPELHVE